MPPSLPGTNLPGGTLPNIAQNQANPTVPTFWANFSYVNQRILALWNTDPKRAEEMLTEFKKLVG